MFLFCHGNQTYNDASEASGRAAFPGCARSMPRPASSSCGSVTINVKPVITAGSGAQLALLTPHTQQGNRCLCWHRRGHQEAARRRPAHSRSKRVGLGGVGVCPRLLKRVTRDLGCRKGWQCGRWTLGTVSHLSVPHTRGLICPPLLVLRTDWPDAFWAQTCYPRQCPENTSNSC